MPDCARLTTNKHNQMESVQVKMKNVLQTLITSSVISVLAVAAAQASTTKPDAQFEVVKHYGLDGGERWDYVAYDPVRHHLFVSRADGQAIRRDSEHGRGARLCICAGP
jgi:hypothetical protein